MVKNVTIIILLLGLIVISIVTFDDGQGQNHSAKHIDDSELLCSDDFEANPIYHAVNRTWNDYEDSSYCAFYLTFDSTYQRSGNYRNAYTDDTSETYQEFWGKLYENLYFHDRHLFTDLIDTLECIQASADLNRDQFANVLVSFVQDIPYSYVLRDDECNYEKDKSSPCVDGIKYGILSPYEFLHTLKGDCDTRTVLLYTLFKYFNYSPKIVVSKLYAHSMILVDVNAVGEYFYEYGKKYYFWETTGTGWPAGIIPAGMRDLYWWDVVLE